MKEKIGQIDREIFIGFQINPSKTELLRIYEESAAIEIEQIAGDIKINVNDASLKDISRPTLWHHEKERPMREKIVMMMIDNSHLV